jgi:cyclopropane-fatty-acyl-phospholipid synthase
VEAYDAVVSVGAFEHFSRPEMSPDDRIVTYRNFFKKVRQVLKPGRRLSLQTIVFDRMLASEVPSFITDQIFPGSMLPRPAEIFAAADRILSLETMRNDGLDYGRTCREWAKRLDTARVDAIEMVGEKKTNEYLRYLRMSAVAFERKQFSLFRLKFSAYLKS